MKPELSLPRREVDPHHRVRRLLAASVEGAMSDDPVEDALLRLFRKDTDVPREVLLAAYAYHCPRTCNSFEALLLAGGTKEDIHNLLDVDFDVVDIFTTYFFDVSVFQHYPDRWNYVNSPDGPAGRDAEPGHQFKEVALTLGIEFLRPKLRPDIGIVSNEHAAARALTMAYMRVCEDGNSQSPRRAEEARKWAEIMVQTLKAAAEISSDKGHDIRDLVLDLQRDVPEHAVIGEILH